MNFNYFIVPAYVEPQPTDGKFVVRKGSTITLSCRATGNPMPTVTWQRKVTQQKISCNMSNIKMSIEDIVQIYLLDWIQRTSETIMYQK